MKKRTSFLICLVLIMLVALSMAACHKNNVPDDPIPDDDNKTYPTVIFNFNDGTGKTQSVKMTASAKAPNATREGYRFLGWSKSAGGTTFVENLRNLADGTQVFAIWEVKLFRVNFVVNGEVVSSDNVEYGKAATAPDPETFKDKIPTGKIFAGWDKEFDVIKGVLQVNALLSDMQSYTVTFYKEKGDASPYSTQSGTADDVIPAVKNPELAGFKFEGWFDADGNEYVAGKRFEKDATYYAKWSVAKPNAATASPLTMVYGETKTLVATPASNNVEAINYAYAWYLAGRKVADGLEIEISGLNAGAYTYTVKVTASYEGRGESSAESTVTVTVQKATLTATVSPINLVYGDDFASAEVTYSGFKGSDDESVVRGEKHFLTEYAQGADVGKYSLSVKVGEDGLWADNYDVSVVTSFITVKEKAVSASVADINKTYDGSPLTFSGNVPSEDLLDGDVLTVEFKTDSPNAGKYFYRGGESSGITVLSVKVERNGKDVSKNYKVTLTVSASIGLANVEYTPVENVETTFDGKEHFASLTLEGFNVTYSTDGENFKAAIPTFTDAGAYTVYYRIERGGYKTENNSFTVTIKKLAVLVKAKDTVVTYGNKAPTLSYEFVGEKLSDELEALLKDDLLAALSTDYVQGDGVGEKTVYMAKIDSDNFDVTVQNGKIEIRPRAATVKADDKTVVYGDAANLTATFVGLLEGDTAEATLTCDENVSGTPVGEYEISVSATHANYVFTFESGTLTVTPREITLRVSDGTVTYGDEFDAAKQNYDLVSGEIFGSDKLNVAYSSSYRVGENAGETFEISAVCNNNNYSATVQNGTLTVVKRAISVKATAKTVVYGEAAPETYDFDVLSGSVYGTDDLGLSFAAKTYYTGASVGAYDVTGTATNGNYDVTVEKGTLTVTARKITVKAADKTAEYGSAAPSLSYSLVSGSVYGTDDLGFTAKTSYSAGDKAAEYEITVEFSENVNYDVTVQSGTLTVTPKEITVSRTVIVAQSGNKWSLVIEGEEISGMVSGDKLYLTLRTSSAEDGEYVANGDLSDDFEEPTLLKILRGSEDRLASYVVKYDLNVTISTKHITHDAKGYVDAYDGRAHSGTVTVEEGTLITYSTDGEDYSLVASPEFTNVGTYTVFFKLEKEGFTQTVGKFTVEIQKRAATVKANDVTVVYGGEAPEYGYSQTGILAEDLESLNITVSSDYAKGANVGQYDVTVSFTENANYEIVTTVGKLTVAKKAVDVSPSDVTVSYGDEAAAFEIPAEYASVVRLETDYYQGANVGEYVATAIVLDDNYSVTTSSKVICVPRKATVKAEDKTVEYGYEKPNLTYVVSGLYGSDSVEVRMNVGYTPGMEVGTPPCEIMIVVEDNENYDFTVQTGTLTIEKRKVIVTVRGQTVVYGDAFDASVCGFESTPLYGDDKVSVTSYSTTYYVGANAGETFEIGAETEEDDNYEFTVVKGVLTVLKANLTTTVTGPSAIVYGDTPTFDFIVTSGLKAGDEKADVGVMTYSTDYLTAPAAGTFKVNGTLDSKNYTATVSSYDMTVEKATLIVTVNPTATVTYDDPIPDFGFTAEGFKFSDNEACLTIRYETTYKKSSPVIAEGYRYNVDLDKSTAQNYTLTKGADGVLTVEKANIDLSTVTVPSFTGTYYAGVTLKDFTLKGGFSWVNENEQVTCNVTKYKATYNPDVQNYNSVTLDVSVVLDKANAEVVATSKEVDWNNTEYIVSEHLGASTTNPETTLVYSFIDLPQNTKVLDGGIYRIRVTSPASTNYNEAHKDVTFAVKAARVDGGSLMTVEDALGRTGTITLAEADGVYAKAFLTAGDYTLASGATLLLSASSDSSALGSATYNSDAGAPSYVDTNASYIEHILTIMTGANLTVNGNVRIQGILGRGTVGYSGGTSGKHSQLVNNGTMTFNSGSNLDAKGFVKGTGTATFKSGANVYSPFVVIDFRGGTNTVTAFNKGKISPFNQYEMPNVQCRQIYEAGAKHTGYVDLYASSKHNTDKKEVIGSSGIIQISSGYLEKTYDRSAQKATLTIVGTATLGSLTLSVSGVDAKMSDVQFPIPWTYNVNIGDGTTATTLTAPYKYKVLTGANVTVAQNATLTTSAAVIVYSTFTDTAFGGSIYPSKSAANFVVNGTYNVNGSFGGNIKSTASGATVVVSSSATLSVDSTEGNSGDTSSAVAIIGGGDFFKVFKIVETARFGAGTVSVSEETFTTGIWPSKKTHTYNAYSYSGGQSLAKGTTYTYNGSAWN